MSTKISNSKKIEAQHDMQIIARAAKRVWDRFEETRGIDASDLAFVKATQCTFFKHLDDLYRRADLIAKLPETSRQSIREFIEEYFQVLTDVKQQALDNLDGKVQE